MTRPLKATLAGVVGVVAFIAADVWFDIDYQLWANIALLSVAALVTSFGALYGIRSRWKTNPIGRVFFGKSMILPLVLWQASLSSWWSTEYPGRQHIRFAIYTIGAIAYLWMIRSLWREQQRDRKP